MRHDNIVIIELLMEMVAWPLLAIEILEIMSEIEKMTERHIIMDYLFVGQD